MYYATIMRNYYAAYCRNDEELWMVRLSGNAFVTSPFSVVFLDSGLTILAVGNIFRADFGLSTKSIMLGALWYRPTLADSVYV